jgi:hypothetical protein
MSLITLRPWPALPGGGPAPDRLDVERAIRGKVHGAASDFRWIAATPGLDPQTLRPDDLLLGSEDVPAKAVCWRASESGYCAVSCYPSRARDAAGRSGFLEKQVLAWSPGAEVPAALGALLLLPRAATFDDCDWWDQADDPSWSRPGFLLTLAAEPPVAVENLETVIERGRAALREAVEETSLARLYSALLARRRDLAFLPGLERPLPPEALAVLLLPLPRDIADRLSIAGWDVSNRIDPEAFPWDVLVCRQIPAAFRSELKPEITEAGRQAARELLEREDFGGPGPDSFPDPAPFPGPGTSPTEDPDPPSRPTFTWERPKEERSAPAGGTPQVLERLRVFATAEDKRWLGPEDLAGTAPLRLMEDQAETLAGFVRSVEAEISRLNGPPGKREQLEVKADLLRAAALALAPSAVNRDRLPRSGRVPAVLFCPRLAEGDWNDFGRLLGEARLEEAIRQSLACKPDLFGKEIEDWLARWRPG